MSDYAGFFELRSPPDLFQKLQWEYEGLRETPTDQYRAFNLFVTAEHLLDWQSPGDANKERRKEARARSVLLRVCTHVANGAKHFKVTYGRHDSVKGTQVSAAVFQPGAFPADAFQTKKWLVIELDGDAARELGPQIEVLDLARRLVEYWGEFFKTHPAP